MSLALTASLPPLPSFRRQQLLLEFTALKYHCPQGIYLTPNPNDPACWSGIYFVREGPYSSAILRFELLFPPSYPEAPPLVIFSTEIFHPLLVPLTTYAFSPGAADPSATYSASDTERLPPGALSLRYGFPHWFPVAERGRTTVRAGVGRHAECSGENELGRKHSDGETTGNVSKETKEKERSSTITLLEYVKAAFENPKILDDLPLEAAGNSNAWHAWRSHRGLPKQNGRSGSPSVMNSSRTGASPRNPADWNWDGVWEARVQDGIQETASEALLFGSKNVRGSLPSSDAIRFVKYDDEKLASIQDDMLRMHEFAAYARKE